jgi:hypothetical protein
MSITGERGKHVYQFVINLHQVCKWQLATSLIFSTCSKSVNTSMLMQVEKIRLVKTCYPQTCCKLFEQLAASLWITTCSKSDFHNLPINIDVFTDLLQVVLSDLSLKT